MAMRVSNGILPDKQQGHPHVVSGLGQFNVFSRENCALVSPYNRRDFYKVTLILGKGTVHYADKWVSIDKPALLFSNPMLPYSWQACSPDQKGWFTLFTDQFLQEGGRSESLRESPLFRIGGLPVIFLDKKREKIIADIFKKMIDEIESEYTHKYDLLRNLLHLLLHEALKMQPNDQFEHYCTAAGRIVSLFLELLERQFPIDGPDTRLKLKSANDYARALSIHVNSLNRSVKEVTGKTTSEHIAARIVREAKALLKFTEWNIGEIADGLGFDEPAYFSNFFKKRTGQSPMQLRGK